MKSTSAILNSVLDEHFLAPEQLSVKPEYDKNGQIDISSLPVLDEKIDIYKIPAITAHILGDVQGHNSIMEMLKPIHSACLKTNNSIRPSAKIVKHAYIKILNKL